MTPIPQYATFRDVELRCDYLYGVESFLTIRAEMDPLLTAQWNETEAAYRPGEPDPDYGRYQSYEDARLFYLFTARDMDDRALAGYLGVLVNYGLQDRGKLLAKEQAFYVLPAARIHHIGAHLLDYAERALKAFGVATFDITSKAPVGGRDLAPLMTRRGYKPHSLVYKKHL